MADIKKRSGKKGTKYQVRYRSSSTKSGYAYKTFDTQKEARRFIESGQAKTHGAQTHHEISTVKEAAERWLKICEKEGLNGGEPVTQYTLKNYAYRAGFVTDYDWPVSLQELTSPHVVEFRSWLLNGGASRAVASKVLATLFSILKEMSLRGITTLNAAVGVTIRQDSRYQTPVQIPSKAEILSLLAAADQLANSKNAQIQRTWERYRPILYLAVDSGMRPQEYLALAGAAIKARGVYIDRAIDGSGNKITVTKTRAGRRFIDLSEHTLDMVRQYADRHAGSNKYDLVFPSRNGRWIDRKNWQRRGFNVACLKAGLIDLENSTSDKAAPKYRPYDLRHFYASRLIASGVNLKKIQTLMGHAGIETTFNVYGHLLDDDESDTVSIVRDLGAYS